VGSMMTFVQNRANRVLAQTNAHSRFDASQVCTSTSALPGQSSIVRLFVRAVPDHIMHARHQPRYSTSNQPRGEETRPSPCASCLSIPKPLILWSQDTFGVTSDGKSRNCHNSVDEIT
jgi:hypothetical protein